jgi:SOS response regulatory protein OraA/RecX
MLALPVTKPNVTATISPAAERMRRYRQRRRDGVRVLSVELVETEIDELVAHNLLKEEERDDHCAIMLAVYAALYAFFGETLDV